MSGHTKGPWIMRSKLSASENHRGFWIGNDRYWIADVSPCNNVDGDPSEEGKANARLIAAAPDLLEALKLITKQARSWHDFHHGSDIVRCDSICDVLPACEAVISKAEGK